MNFFDFNFNVEETAETQASQPPQKSQQEQQLREDKENFEPAVATMNLDDLLSGPPRQKSNSIVQQNTKPTNFFDFENNQQAP